MGYRDISLVIAGLLDVLGLEAGVGEFVWLWLLAAFSAFFAVFVLPWGRGRSVEYRFKLHGPDFTAHVWPTAHEGERCS